MFFFSAPALAAFWQATPLDSGQIPDSSGNMFLWIALAVGFLSLLAAVVFARNVLANESGTPEMRLISDAIREGAEAFMKRQYSAIAMLAVVIAVMLYAGYYASAYSRPFANKVVISFIIGAACSALSGYSGMFVSIRANIRVASAARTSIGKALQTALRGGAVTGLVVVSLSLLGIGLLFLVFGGLQDPQQAPTNSSDLDSAPRLSPSSPSWAAASTPRPPTWAPTWSARSRPESPRTIRATRRSSPTWLATMSATAPAAARTSLNPPPRKMSAP